MGSKLLDAVIGYIGDRRFESIDLQTWKDAKMRGFYGAMGFKVFEQVPDGPNNVCSLRMRKELR